MAPRWPGRNVRAEAGGDHRIRIEAAAELAVFDSSRESEGAAGKIEEVARDVARKVPDGLLALVVLDERDIIHHRLSDGARAAEEVERHAARRRIAGRERPECNSQLLRVDVAEHALLGVVLAVKAVHVPVPFTVADV